MGNNYNDFEAAFSRLRVFNIHKQVELAKVLGLGPASISDAKKRGQFPKKWVVILCELYNVTPQWLLGTEVSPPPAQISQETLLIKSLIADISELKQQLVYVEGTVSLLRGEIETMKERLPSREKKKSTKKDYSVPEEKIPVAV